MYIYTVYWCSARTNRHPVASESLSLPTLQQSWVRADRRTRCHWRINYYKQKRFNVKRD